MKKSRKIVFLIIINGFLFLIFCEGTGLVYFYFTNHEIFYRRTDLKIGFKEPEKFDVSQQMNVRLHPFWGYQSRPGRTVQKQLSRRRIDRMVGKNITPAWIHLAANEYGFYSTHPYPYKAHTNDFVIGVFGGSVAQWFTLQGSKMFIEQLQRQHPLLENRSIVILNFAHGGFKQPQQLQVLTYFLAMGQHFDMVINIDGFNEVALSHLNYLKNVDLSFPERILSITETLTKKSMDIGRLEALLNMRKSRNSLRKLEQTMARNVSAGLNLWFSLIQHYKTSSYRKWAAKFEAPIDSNKSPQESEIMQINQLPSIVSSENEFEYIARLWANSSVLMKQVLEGHRVKYFHILQPNQYYSQREFNSEEAFVINSKSPYKSGVEHGYPYLLKQIDRLRAHGVQFIDATKIFDETPQPIYSDSCCHYNQLGNEIFATYIAQKVIPQI